MEKKSINEPSLEELLKLQEDQTLSEKQKQALAFQIERHKKYERLSDVASTNG